MSAEIRVWNRASGVEEMEQVYGDQAVRWAYGTATGRRLADQWLSRHWVSRWYGAYQASSLSRHKIQPFIEKFQIRMDEFESGPFQSFNEFFIRKFRPGARSFVNEPHRMPAFAEARYLGFDEVGPEDSFPVKGEFLSPSLLLGSRLKEGSFEGGALLIARLCPTDYHRYHYPDDGETEREFGVSGKLHSVNPLALRERGEIFATNERKVSILRTRNFGRLAYIEVGALCVGLIVQTHPAGQSFRRGQEKGYFLFGASTVIVLGEKGAWKPSPDILSQTRQRRETFIRLGDEVALK